MVENLNEDERRAIVSVADALVYRAGRTVLVMALRGSRAKRVLQFEGTETARGYGAFRRLTTEKALAKVDVLFQEKLLRIHYERDLPLIGYTDAGLALARRYGAEDWLEVIRLLVPRAAVEETVEIPFEFKLQPQRCHDTLLLLLDLVRHSVDRSWIPLLQQWATRETKRARSELTRIIDEIQRRGRAEGVDREM